MENNIKSAINAYNSNNVNKNNANPEKGKPEKEKVRYPLYVLIRELNKNTKMLENPEDPEAVEKVHAVLDPFIRDELSWRFGSRLPQCFDSAVEHICSQIFHIKECKPFYTESDVRRLIGSEIGWINTFREHAENDPYNISSRAEMREKFLSNMRNGFTPLSDQNSPLHRMIELHKYAQSWADFPAFGFGIKKLDEAVGGIMPGEICVLTGAPGTMKTSLALNAAENAVNKTNTKNNKVLYFSVDMAPRDITMRLLERESRIPETKLRTMLASESGPENDTISVFQNKVYEKYNTKLAIYGHRPGNPLNIKKALNKCLIRRPGLVIIDYLTRLKTAGQTDLEFVEQAMPEILAFAQQYETAFLLVSQMARASRSEQVSGRTGGHSRGGGIIEELAHTEIELFQQFNSENSENKNNLYNYNFMEPTPLPPMIIACVTKARRGVAGQYFSLNYQGNIKMFDGNAQRVKIRSHKNIIFEPV